MGRRVHAGVAPQATSLTGLFQGGSDTFAIGSGIFWAAFDLGRVWARLRAADARTEAALAHYEQHVLLARGDTRNALVTFTRLLARRDALWASAQASEKATMGTSFPEYQAYGFGDGTEGGTNAEDYHT